MYDFKNLINVTKSVFFSNYLRTFRKKKSQKKMFEIFKIIVE